MKVYHVWQVVKPVAFCSCVVGNHWVKSCDTEAEATAAAEKYNQHRFLADSGIEYVVTGPQEESEHARF